MTQLEFEQDAAVLITHCGNSHQFPVGADICNFKHGGISTGKHHA